MDGNHSVQQMVEQALSNIKRTDEYLSWIGAGNQIKMLDKTAEQSTAEWEAQLKRHRQMDVDYINAIKDDNRYSVRIDRVLHPEFGNT